MSIADSKQLRSFLERARQAALTSIPEHVRNTTVFRESLCWSLEEGLEGFDAERLRHAIVASLGPAHESVFSFLRYFDYAQWDPDREALCMASEQWDRYLPLYVYWELTRHAALFQRSQQPSYVGSDLSITETARYVADVIDGAGRLYEALGMAGDLDIQIQIIGAIGRRVGGSSSPCASSVLIWSDRHAPSQWIEERERLARRCVRELLSQCDAHLDLNGAISRGLRTEFSHLDARRALAP